ncbi:MAG: ABC transporter substrate-binding protein [Bacteroidetes bacterium]|nr:ABC transporter substrate-binding protein [Bacteroidota bacterium]
MKKISITYEMVIAIVAICMSIYSLIIINRVANVEEKIGKNKITTLKVGVLSVPPVSLYDAGTKTATGHSVDIIAAIGKRTNLRIEFISSSWETFGSALISNQVDVVIGPIFMTEGRAFEYLFSKPIYDFAVVPVISNENNSINAISDLQKSGLRVAVGRGGFDADFVSKFMKGAIISEFPPNDPNLGMLEVAAGRADVAIVDYGTAVRFAENNSNVRVLEKMVLSRQNAGFLVRSEDYFLKEFLDVAIRNLKISGELDSINLKYSKSKIWYDEAGSNFQ